MVPEINIWGWDNEPKHLRRHITAGRIFCLEFSKDIYCFGRIMTKTLVGHIAEFFDHTSSLPEFSEELLKSAKRIDVEIINTQKLFELNTKKTWRVIGDQRSYVPENVGEINYLIVNTLRLVDFFGIITEISKNKAERLPEFVSLDENEIKQALAPKIGKEYFSDDKQGKKKSGIEIWGWDKKPRTMLRYLEPGMIFCFKFDENKYCFGRLMTDIICGHIAEFFDFTSQLPKISEDDITNTKRIAVDIIDSYSLFDRKSEGEWRIIGKCHNYIPDDVEGIFFYYGIGSGLKLVDFCGHEMSVTPEEAIKHPPLSPHGNYSIKQLLIKLLG